MKPQTFFEKFDRFADAPDAVAKMRELVLQLAMQGRLVSQSLEDEPADALVATIAEDRTAFVKEKSLARQRVFAPIEDTQCPFALPRGWAWTRLGSLCRVQAGFAFESAAFVQGDSGVPMIRIRDITKDHTQVNYVGKYREEFLVDTGDYLVGMDGNFTVAKWRGPKALLNQRVSRLQWYSQRLEPSFFAMAAQFRLSELQGTKAYTTVDHLSSGQIENAVVPLPPLAEQKRIVAKVDELMALCDRLEAQQQERDTRHAALARASVARFADAPTPANLAFLFHPSYAISPADLRKSILALAVQGKLVPQDPNDDPAEEMLSKIEAEKERLSDRGELKADKKAWVNSLPNPPHDIPESWCWVRLQDVFEISRGGSPRPAGDSRFFGGPIPWITVGEITKDAGKYLTETATGLTEEGSERSRFINPGDLLLTNSGATLGVPKISKIRGCINDGVAVLRLFHHFDLNDFGCVYLTHQTPAFRNVNQGMGQPNLNTPIIAGWFFPLPPLAEQRRIVAKVDQLMALVDELETQLAASRASAAKLLSALVAELTGTMRDSKVAVPSVSGAVRRGGSKESQREITQTTP